MSKMSARKSHRSRAGTNSNDAEEQHPLELIRNRLWKLADEIPLKANGAPNARDVLDVDSLRTKIIRRMRMWALRVVAELSDSYTKMADDGSLMMRVIETYREQFGPGSYAIERDEDLLYELNREVAAALYKVEEQEIFDECVPVWASARVALQGLQQAILTPRSEDIRALAMQFSLVPEYMALAAAYTTVSMGNLIDGGDEQDLAYFIDRERDPRIREIVEALRKELGRKWLDDLNLRLTTDVTEEFEPPTDASPGSGRSR